jgi:hypothetical protein
MANMAIFYGAISKLEQINAHNATTPTGRHGYWRIQKIAT